LRNKFDHVQCFPVGMADDGIDAIVEGSMIYQVKWSSKLEQNPHTCHPDAFLNRLLAQYPSEVVATLERLCAGFRNPPKTTHEFLASLASTVPVFVDRAADALDQSLRA
jgi:hypothetical protein